jgi:succinate dehydrogenase / fumarate reductase, flavoprotein subunit
VHTRQFVLDVIRASVGNVEIRATMLGSSAGLHGANRLGGNSLSDLLVFGRRAGISAAQFAKQNQDRLNVDERAIAEEQALLLRPLVEPGPENPFLVQQELQAIMASKVGIARDEEALKNGLASILDLRVRAQRMGVQGSRVFNPGWHTARDDLFMLTVAEAITRAAIERRESRGAHWRTDYPEKDAELGKLNFVVKKVDDRVEVSTRPTPQPVSDLEALIAVGRK